MSDLALGGSVSFTHRKATERRHETLLQVIQCQGNAHGEQQGEQIQYERGCFTGIGHKSNQRFSDLTQHLFVRSVHKKASRSQEMPGTYFLLFDEPRGDVEGEHNA